MAGRQSPGNCSHKDLGVQPLVPVDRAGEMVPCFSRLKLRVAPPRGRKLPRLTSASHSIRNLLLYEEVPFTQPYPLLHRDLFCKLCSSATFSSSISPFGSYTSICIPAKAKLVPCNIPQTPLPIGHRINGISFTPLNSHIMPRSSDWSI
jgi:hypothetical protein